MSKMANEKRLIDANSLIDCFEKEYKQSTYPYFHIDEITDEIMDAPTVDAVEVVRCKDCKNGRQPWLEGQTMVKCMVGKTMLVTPEHFCSYGERKDK